MRLSARRFFVAAAAVALAGCHGEQPSAPQSKPVASQPIAAPGDAGAAPASPTASSSGAIRRVKQRSAPIAQDVAQIDLGSEGGVRDGSYAMWVHVTENGKPLKSVKVVAIKESDKPVAARTNEDGDAMLRVQPATYRIAASKGRATGEKTVTFHPGDQYELDLTP